MLHLRGFGAIICCKLKNTYDARRRFCHGVLVNRSIHHSLACLMSNTAIISYVVCCRRPRRLPSRSSLSLLLLFGRPLQFFFFLGNVCRKYREVWISLPPPFITLQTWLQNWCGITTENCIVVLSNRLKASRKGRFNSNRNSIIAGKRMKSQKSAGEEEEEEREREREREREWRGWRSNHVTSQ